MQYGDLSKKKDLVIFLQNLIKEGRLGIVVAQGERKGYRVYCGESLTAREDPHNNEAVDILVDD